MKVNPDSRLSRNVRLAVAMARILDAGGRYAEEAEVLRDAADRSNFRHWLYLTLANVEIKLGDKNRALDAFDQADRWSPFVGDAYGLGETFRAQVAAGREQARKLGNPVSR